MQQTLPLKDIIVEGRLREDLGDVEELACSIRDNGLLQPVVVEAVKSPVINQREEEIGRFTTYQLRAGGRRYQAFTLLSLNKVPCKEPDFYLHIPVVLFNEMPAHQRIVIEMEENLRRKDMTWLEKAVGIVKYHNAKKTAAILDDGKWSQAMTGELLNLDQASVSLAFSVVEAIKKGNKKVAEAESLTDAIKILVSDKLDEAQAERLRRIQLKRTEAGPVVTPIPSVGRGQPITTTVHPGILVSAKRAEPETPADKIQATHEQIAAWYHVGNALTVLPLLAKTTVINHIICDPPYGIDMENLSRSDSDRFDTVARIAETHKVDENLKLIPEFLKVAFNAIALDGFLCMWYDLDHHEKIRKWAEEVGWTVCRWPFHWCKTSSCLNQAASYNITKAVEHCYFFRRSSESIIKKKQPVNFLLASGDTSSSHPFTKPKAVWDYLIETVSLEGQVICDPFAGEGSSLAAIFQSKRNPVGIEIDEKHIASGLSFIQSKLNKKSILDDLLTSSVI